MKYINQISFVLALAGVCVVVFTFSSTFLDRSEFEPIAVVPVEIEKPMRPAAQQGFTTNRKPANTPSPFAQPLANRQGGPSRNPSASLQEQILSQDEIADSPLITRRQTSQADTTTNRRAQTIPNRYLNPIQNRPLPARERSDIEERDTSAQTPQTRRGSALVGSPRSKRPTNSPSNPTAYPYGTAVQKRDSGTNPNPPPPRGSMQRNRPPQ